MLYCSGHETSGVPCNVVRVKELFSITCTYFKSNLSIKLYLLFIVTISIQRRPSKQQRHQVRFRIKDLAGMHEKAPSAKDHSLTPLQGACLAKCYLQIIIIFSKSRWENLTEMGLRNLEQL